MAWTTPRTWSTGEVITQTLLNTHLRDNLLGLEYPYFRETGDVTVASTAAETSLFTAAPTIVGGDMGSNGRLVAVLIGTVTVNTTGTLTLRVKLGGTTLIASGALDLVDSATATSWRLLTEIENQGSASAQVIAATLELFSIGGTGAATGVGGFTVAGSDRRGGLIVNTAAVNTGSNQTFDVTAQWSASHASLSITKTTARVALAQG